MANNCPLCNSTGVIFYQHKKQRYYQCSNCSGIYIDKNLLLSHKEEELRYREHNNNVEDEDYQKFVSPITSAIMRDYSEYNIGLDFGAGTGPVITKVLEDNGFHIVQYDPFFHDYPALLEKQYDYIACCEVVEHFHDPKKEFELLKSLLLPNGNLYCMTDIYDENIDFHNWYYKNDPTHVFIYQKKTAEWIKEEFGFLDMNIAGRLITFFN